MNFRMKMRVIRITPRLKLGGVEVGILNELAVVKNSSSINYHLISIEKPDENVVCAFKDGISESNNVNLNMRWWEVFNLYKIKKSINFQTDDIIVSSLWKAHLLSLLIQIVRPDVKIVPFFHSSRSAHFLDKFFTAIILKRCESAFVDSTSTEEFIKNKIAKRNVTLYRIPFVFKLPNCIEPREANEVIKFVFIGRLNKVKDIISAIKLFNVYNKVNPRSTFDIYGPDEGELKNCYSTIDELKLGDVVNYNGVANRKDIGRILSGADFFLQTSSREGMAASVVEAMQYGVIPVVTAVGDIPSYSENKISAFHLNSLNEAEFKRVADDINFCITSGSYSKMSSNAISSIYNLGDYSDSFFESLKNISLRS